AGLPMNDILVRAKGLTKAFGAVTAIAEATFEVAAGDQIALVGPSGSGKSTLLHLIAAIDRPTEGQIEWPALGGQRDLRPGPVAIAFQGPSLLPPLTVAENIGLPVLLAGGTEVEAAAAAEPLIERLGLSDIAAKLPEEISGGQAQRAGLARALAGQPRLILADEPTGQLDSTTADGLMTVLLEQVRATQAALIVATHDTAVAGRLPLRWQLIDRRMQTGAELSCSS
ncbi:MAG TPA: ATP-binding cassette domain-containing protein, partial [Streptosporangiaceae bacterium]